MLEEMIARGWKLFPVAGGKKAPPLIEDWENRATDNLEALHAWEERFPGCNWGIACGPSGLTVIDVDVKKGAPGRETYRKLRENPETPFPETLTVKTPSGGRHFIYAGKTRSSVGTLGPGIDTRSSGGYVLLAGSTLADGGASYAVVNPVEPAPVPAWIVERLGTHTPAPRIAEEPATELDQPHNLLRAIEYLQMKAPPAVEGEGGDETTYKTACRVRDLGISEVTALEILYRYYSPRCLPPWEYSELEVKVRNAYAYARGQAGENGLRASAEDFPVYGTPAAPEKGPPVFRCDDLDIATIPPREWILGRRYIKSYTTVTVAPGGLGKSTLVLAECASVVTGRPLTGLPVHRTGPAWYYNLEDPLDEIKRRVAALSHLHGLTRRDRSGLLISSGLDYPLILAQESTGGPVLKTERLGEIEAVVKREGVVLFAIDPLVRAHLVSENDNGAIDTLMRGLAEISNRTGVAISLVHHTRKGAATPGSMDSARGASSLLAAARIAHTLTPMDEAEAKYYQVDPKQASWYFRLDDAKANLSPPGEHTKWYSRKSVNLGQGDVVGAILPADLEEERALTAKEKALIDAVFAHWTAPISCYSMATVLGRHAPGLREISTKNIRKSLVEIFAGVVRSRGGKFLTAVLEEENGKKVLMLTDRIPDVLDFFGESEIV